MRNVAAIDIGSNATRLLIKEAESMNGTYIPEMREGKDAFIRSSVKLGYDVYQGGYISDEKISQLCHMLFEYKVMMEQYDVTDYRACATASFRDAKNGREAAERISQETGIHIDIITGEEETGLVRLSYYSQRDAHQGGVLFADVGGGSTDISFCQNGQLVQSRSFDVGSMRMVSHTQSAECMEKLAQYIDSISRQYSDIHLVGSGGSIKLICHLFHPQNLPDVVAVDSIQRLHDELLPLSLEERMSRYRIKSDRAEIIVEAASIFLHIAKACHAETIEAPRIGVRDGIIATLL